jgi:hypothetical protein
MNPSWITGHMPDEMYELEHPGHLEEARLETEEALKRQLERVRRRNDEDLAGSEKQNTKALKETKDES